ncbi:MAG: hypothetical protein Q9220_006393 [cf. Caloplaca sp. 1 TL-2023]
MSPTNDQMSSVKGELLRSPLATPHWGVQSGSAFTVRATTVIDASPAAVLETLLCTSKYPEWNNFVPRVTFEGAAESQGRLREGILFTEHVDMYGDGKPSGLIKMNLLLTSIEEKAQEKGTGYQVAWLGKGYPDWALRVERVHDISVDANGTTIYDVWETFSGPLALLARLLLGGTLVNRFRQWNYELKMYTEGHAEETGPGSKAKTN